MKKSYYAVIPASVRYDEKLPMGARMLYGELTALANEKGYCWATNSYFAELYNVTTTTISNWIAKLEKQGHIHREIIYKEGSKEIKERRIYITPIKNNFNTPTKNFEEGIKENFNTPIKKIFKENNTISNNTFNITEDIESTSSKDEKNSPKEDVPYKETVQAYSDICKSFKKDVPYKEIVQAYNDICKSLPSVRVISDKRKKKMGVIYREVGDLNIIIEAFKKAESSDFLSGRNGKWGGCNFDWLINYNNFIKVIEGTYDNRNGGQGGDNGPSSQSHSQNKYGW